MILKIFLFTLIYLNQNIFASKYETPVKETVKPLGNMEIYHLNEVLRPSWRAETSKFKDWSSDSIKRLMGVNLADYHKKLEEAKLEIVTHDESKDVPDEFDSRTQWPNCPTIQEVRDQGNCGSCWAISAVETMSDRECVHSNGQKNVHLSTQDMVACCKICGFGCDGGYPHMAWEFFKRSGVCSGGNYNSSQGCKPYTIEACEHHTTGSRPPCQGDSKTPVCTKSCENTAYNVDYNTDKNFGQSVYTVKKDPKQIQLEILTNGPVQTAFTVYEDFLNYKTGVYEHKTGIAVGGHAVKIIGWGVDKDSSAPYWLVANSWNTDWAEDGFFRILRGKNECDFESGVVAGLPKV